MCKKINVSQMGWMNMHNYYLTVGLLTKKLKYPRTQSNIQLCFWHTLAKKTTGSRTVFTYFRKASQIFVLTVMFIRDVHLHNWGLDAWSRCIVNDTIHWRCIWRSLRYDSPILQCSAIRCNGKNMIAFNLFSSDRQQIINELVSSDF